MKSQIEDLGPCRKKVEITIPAETMREELESGYQEAAQYAQVPGFRAGKVPRHILEKKYGPSIKEHAGKQLVEKAYQDALEEQGLKPLGEPRIEGLEDEIDFNEELTFFVTFDIHPEIEIGDVKGIEVTKLEISVEDKEIEETFSRLAGSRATFEPTDDAKLDKDDRATGIMEFHCDGDMVKEIKDAKLVPSMPIPGADKEEYSAKLLNRKAGEETTIPLTFQDNFPVEACRGKEGELKVKIEAVERLVTPEINDDLAKEVGCEGGLEELRKVMGERILEQKNRADRERKEGELVTGLLAQHPFEIPAGLLEQQFKADLARMRSNMLRQGMKEEEVAAKTPSMEDELRGESELQLKRFFILKEVAKKEKIFVTEDEIKETIQGMASMEKISPGEMRERLDKADRLGELRAELIESKVMDHLMKHATLVEK